MSDTNIAITKASKASIFGIIVPPHIVNHSDPDQTKLLEFLGNEEEVDAAMIVAPRHVLENAKSTNLAAIPDSDANYFKPLGASTPMILHPATYTVLIVEDDAGERMVFSYERPGKMENEVRLGGKRSIGIGGHGDIIDVMRVDNKLSFTQSLENTADRELHEELMLNVGDHKTYKLKNLGWLLDLEDVVGCTHIGAISALYVKVKAFADFKMPEMCSDGNTPLGLVLLSDVTAENNFENWSVMLAKDFDAILAKCDELTAEFNALNEKQKTFEELQRKFYCVGVELLGVSAAKKVFNDQLIHALRSGLVADQISNIGFVITNNQTGNGAYFTCCSVDGTQKKLEDVSDTTDETWEHYRDLLGNDLTITLVVKEGDGAKISSALREAIVRSFYQQFTAVKFLEADNNLLINHVQAGAEKAVLETTTMKVVDVGDQKVVSIFGMFK